MTDETIATGYLRLVPSVDGIQGALGGQFAGAGTSAGKKFGGGFLPSLKGLLATAGGLLLAREVKEFVAQGIKSLSRIEVINTQTATVIKSTGGAANVSAAQIEKLAGALERTTATEAESIQEGANLLLTFKNIRNEVGAGNDIFDRTVTSMVDLARAMGTDAKGGAIQLGKALNDPIKGIAALTRVGITFSEEQKTLIKSLVQSGDLMGAQKIILAELNSQFGGSGAAYAETYAGKVALVGHEFGTMQETILSGVMPALGSFQDLALKVLEKINASPGLAAFVGKLSNLGAGAAERLTAISDKLMELSETSKGITFESLEEAFPDLAPFLLVADALAPVLPDLSKAIAEILPDLAPLIPLIADLVTEILPELTEVLSKLLPTLTDVVTQMQEVGKALQVLEFVTGLIGAVLEANLAFNVLIGTMAESLLVWFQGDRAVERFGNKLLSMKGPVGDFYRWLMSVVNGITGFVDAITSGISKTVSGAMRNVKSFLNDIIRSVNTAIRGLNSFSKTVAGAVGLSAPQIGTIPLLAEGGRITRSGWAWVGEAGPELINMNAGAEVRPLDNPGNALGSSGGLHIGTLVTADPEEAIRRIRLEQRRALVLEGIEGVVFS